MKIDQTFKNINRISTIFIIIIYSLIKINIYKQTIHLVYNLKHVEMNQII